MTDLTELIGYVAAFCTTIAFVPQAHRVWKTGHTRDLSLAMFLIFSCGVALWFCYGWRIGSWPIILANLFTLMLAGYILVMKMTEAKRSDV
ncbi:MAG TPA: SemiSWEET transporter [Dongiaceae bacterium]|nr:SemiSWEET transporter [Dongiaceae bacterium]